MQKRLAAGEEYFLHAGAGRPFNFLADIFNTEGETTLLPVTLWQYLVGIALMLYLGDVFLRRIRLFE